MEVRNLTKTFTIDDHLADDSPFRIAVEFDMSDEEIRDYLRSEGRTDFYLEYGPFLGSVSIKVFNEKTEDYQEIGEPSGDYTYPAQHLAWLRSCSKDFLQNDPPEVAGMSSREILTSTDQRLNDYRSNHQHLFPSSDEELPILYRTREGIFTVSGLSDGVLLDFGIDAGNFQKGLDLNIQEFMRRIKEAFPEIKSPKFRFY